MEQKKRLTKKSVVGALLALAMVLGMVPGTVRTAEAADNPYPSSQIFDGYTTIPCTRYAWQQAYDRMGVAMPSWGNAANWYNNAKNSGWSHGTGTVARPNSIAVWSDGGFGHVAYVVSVNGSTMTINEGGLYNADDNGNITGAYNGTGIREGATVNSTVGLCKDKWNTSQILQGFIYLSGGTQASVSISWSDYDGASVGETNAVLGKRCDMTGAKTEDVSSCGIRLYTDAGTLLKDYPESTAGLKTGYSWFLLWFDVNGELGITLSPGTTYQYKMYAVIGGKTYTSDTFTFTTKGTQAVASYYFNLQGCKDGVRGDDIANYGTVDIYMNGTLVANDVTDYYKQWPTGTKYEIKDIKATSGHTYGGLEYGSLSGTIGDSSVSVSLRFYTTDHTHIKGAYQYYWDAHPHYKCYKCTICGEIFSDKSEETYLSGCIECNRPQKVTLKDFGTSYTVGDSISFTWDESDTKATHFSLYIDKLQDGKYVKYDYTQYASSGMEKTLPEGTYAVSIIAYNSNMWEENHSDWVHAEYDMVPFDVLPVQEQEFTYEISDGKVTITGYTGAGGDVIIPATLGSCPVVSIGERAFASRSDLISVTIPEGVTSIKAGAFSRCTALQAVSLPNSLTQIGSGAFWGSGLTRVVIPDGVTRLPNVPSYISGNGVFGECESLTEVIVSDENAGLISVDGVLFNKEKTELICFPAGKQTVSYTIPDTVTKIADSAFAGCRAMKDVVISENVVMIGACAFQNCTGLKEITIPANVSRIFDAAFACCTSLTSVKFDGSAPRFGEDTFDSFYKVTATICYPANDETWDNCVGKNYWGTLTWAPYSVNENDRQAAVESAGARPGETVTLTVTLKNTEPIRSIAASDITCDTAALTLTGVEWAVKDPVLKTWNREKGNGALTMGELTDLNGAVLTLTFAVKDDADERDYAVGLTLAVNSGGDNEAVPVIPGTLSVRRYLPGDLDGDERVTDADAIYLLMNTFFPEDYPVSQPCDFDGDGRVTDADAIFLLMFTFFPEDYPIGEKA